jgi:hypothetical protein
MDHSMISVLQKQLDLHIQGFDTRRKANKRKALIFKLTITALGGMTTVALGLQGVPATYETSLKNLALVFSALITLLSTWDTFFNHRGLWVRYTAASTSLKSIRAEIQFRLANNHHGLNDEETERLFARMQQVLNDTDEWWQDARRLEMPETRPT